MPCRTQPIYSGLGRAWTPLRWHWECALSAPRGREVQALGGGRVAAGPRRACGDRSTPRYREAQNGNVIFVTAQAPIKPMDAEEIATYMPSECPALETERKGENPASSGPQSGPFVGGQFGSTYCRHGMVFITATTNNDQHELPGLSHLPDRDKPHLEMGSTP